MKCKVPECENHAMYKSVCLCQKHYFRLRRNGTVNTIRNFGAKHIDSGGYVSMTAKGHPLAAKDGSIREHRLVAFEKYKNSKLVCELCGVDTEWRTCHVDHINNIKTDNNPDNLRILCRACNVMRAHVLKRKCEQGSRYSISFNGLTMTASEWARQDSVSVSNTTIIKRIKQGYSIKDALFMPRVTHKNHKNKVNIPKYKNIHEPIKGGLDISK